MARSDPTPEDYTKVSFPFDTLCGGDTRARLLATDGHKVVGVLLYGEGEREYFGQALEWNPDGRFGSNGESYPTMDLPPPPARAASMAEEIDAKLAVIQQRLAANPDAPEEWRGRDEREVTMLTARRNKLLGVKA